MKPTTLKTQMLLVGNLQDFGRPYSSLFLDKESGCLYIFVRMPDTVDHSGKYLVTPVSTDDVTEYLNRKKGLRTIFSGKPSSEARFENGNVVLSQPHDPGSSAYFHNEDLYDPQFCFDKLKLKIFLKRYSSPSYSIQPKPAI